MIKPFTQEVMIMIKNMSGSSRHRSFQDGNTISAGLKHRKYKPLDERSIYIVVTLNACQNSLLFNFNSELSASESITADSH